MALASQNPEDTKKQAADRDGERAALERTSARNGTTGEGPQESRQSEGDRDYGRQGGSIADTGRRTDDPVGVEQVESSAVTKDDAQTAREHQQSPGSKRP